MSEILKYIGIFVVVALVSSVGAYFQFRKEEQKKAEEEDVANTNN